MTIRDRIKRFDRVYAKDLLPSPKNWRTHSIEQADALKGILAEVGWADALLTRETPQGLMLVDGHLRAETAPDSLVPVLVLDVDEAEADKLLATLDPLTGMAGCDPDKLEQLLHEVSTGSEALNKMLADLAEDNGIIPPDFQPTEESPRLDQRATHTCPNCGEVF